MEKIYTEGWCVVCVWLERHREKPTEGGWGGGVEGEGGGRVGE